MTHVSFSALFVSIDLYNKADQSAKSWSTFRDLHDPGDLWSCPKGLMAGSGFGWILTRGHRYSAPMAYPSHPIPEAITPLHNYSLHRTDSIVPSPWQQPLWKVKKCKDYDKSVSVDVLTLAMLTSMMWCLDKDGGWAWMALCDLPWTYCAISGPKVPYPLW